MENNNENLKKENEKKIKVDDENKNKEKSKNKKIVIIAVVILCIILIAIIVAFVLVKQGVFEEDDVNVSSQNELNKDNNVENQDANINQNEITEEASIEKLEIAIENKLLMAYSLSDFEDVSSLSTKKLLSVIAKGINNGWISVKGESSDDGTKYTESQIKSAVYSVFGVKLEENTSAENLEYKDGYYILSKSSNEEIPTIKNITSDVAAGTAYYGFDIYLKSGYVGRYEVAISDDFVKSKILENSDVGIEDETGTELTEEVTETEAQESASASSTTDTTKTWKTAYKEQLQKFYKQYDNSESNQVATEYGIADIDKDGTPELMIRNYTCEADMIMYFFKYENGSVSQLGTLGSSHTAYYVMNNENYILGVNGHMGYEATLKVYISSNKIKTETLGSRELGADEDYAEGDKYIEEVNWNDSSLIDNY